MLVVRRERVWLHEDAKNRVRWSWLLNVPFRPAWCFLGWSDPGIIPSWLKTEDEPKATRTIGSNPNISCLIRRDPSRDKPNAYKPANKHILGHCKHSPVSHPKDSCYRHGIALKPVRNPEEKFHCPDIAQNREEDSPASLAERVVHGFTNRVLVTRSRW